jgi:hypothetical protein
LNLAQGNSSQGSILKKKIIKNAGRVSQGVGPKFNSSTKKKEKKEKL